MEDLAEKDATEKSDAVREAFLAELALDSRKGNGGGSDHLKHAHEKTKEKKKNKEHKKTKDSKVRLCCWAICFFVFIFIFLCWCFVLLPWVDTKMQALGLIIF